MHTIYNICVFEKSEIINKALVGLLNNNPKTNVVDSFSDKDKFVSAVKKLSKETIIIISLQNGMLAKGMELIKKIRNSAINNPIILLSEFISEEWFKAVFRCGINGYVNKNGQYEELQEAIERVSSGINYISQEISAAAVSHFIKGRNDLTQLSQREKRVLQLIVEGMNNNAIAKTLNINAKTVSSYKTRILSKLGISNSVELLKFGLDHKGLIL